MKRAAMETGESRGNQYVPELDGLRCVAVLGVVLFHLRVPGFSIGGLGVWLFFVLSGYLITRILLSERSQSEGMGSFLWRFYARRTLRIFPLYYAYLVVIYAIQTVSVIAPKDYIYFFTYTQNFLLGATHFNYPGLLWHTWSLAIEEQFYLVWPILVYCLSRGSLTAVCSLAVLGAPIYRNWVYLATDNPHLTYTIPLGSADALALGCLCALHWNYMASVSRGAVAVAAGASAVLLVTLVAVIDPEAFWDVRDWVAHPAQMLVFSAAAIMSAALLIVSLRFKLGGVLRSSVIVHIGKISYGIYMWHVLAMVIAVRLLEQVSPAASTNAWLRTAASLVVTYLIAFVSYQYFERPFLRMKDGLYVRKEPALAPVR
jgi:peptidoglycan/LPS O-acetylase OafA/YrhL